jgi:hypothetical protein
MKRIPPKSRMIVTHQCETNALLDYGFLQNEPKFDPSGGTQRTLSAPSNSPPQNEANPQKSKADTPRDPGSDQHSHYPRSDGRRWCQSVSR